MESLHVHNQKTYENICHMYGEGIQRVAVVQPTGSGKSLLMAKLIEDNPDSRFFVLSTRHEINNQFKEKLDQKMLQRSEFNIYCNMSNMKKEVMELLKPDYILLDEMHRALAKEWSKGIKVLLEMYPNAKVLGLSATPIRYLDKCRNVAQELFDGNLACDMSLSQAILDGILPMGRYVCGVYSYEKDAESLNKKIQKSTNSPEEKKELLQQVKVLKENLDRGNGVSDIFRKYASGNEKFVVFLKNTKHLAKMKPIIKKWFDNAGFSSVRMYEVHCKNFDKDKAFQAFKDDTKEGIKLCLSINMVAEGIHGDINGVIMLRETISANMYFQMIGRAFSCGKKTIPLIFDLVANSQFITNAADISFPNELRGEIEKRKSECKKENKDYEVGFDVDEFVVMDEFMDVVSGFKAIEERLQGSWDLYIKALTQFKEREGDCLVSGDHVEVVDGVDVKLGQWCINIRNRIHGKTSTFLTERIKQLEEIEFIWNEKKYRFENSVNDCIRFYEVNNRKPCKGSKNHVEKKLGIFWNYYRNKKYLPKWKKDMLKEIPLFFEREEQDFFEKFYNAALIYKERYGDLNFKKGNIINGYDIYHQYYTLRYKKNKLTVEQIEKLDSIGIDFESNRQIEERDKKIQLAKQAIDKGIIINIRNQFYEGVNFYNFRNSHLNDFTENELQIINKLVPNENTSIPVNIKDVNNNILGTYLSIHEAGRSLYYDFNAVENEEQGFRIIYKRLKGITKNPIYKKKFCFEYDDKKEILENI